MTWRRSCKPCLSDRMAGTPNSEAGLSTNTGGEIAVVYAEGMILNGKKRS